MKIKTESWKVVFFIFICSVFWAGGLKPQFASANEENICSVKWSNYTDKLSNLLSMETLKTILFVGSDGSVFNCYGIELEKSELEFMERLEKTFALDEFEENNLNIGDDICVVSKYNYDHRLVDYSVILPYDKEILENKKCIESFDAAVEYYFEVSND